MNAQSLEARRFSRLALLVIVGAAALSAVWFTGPSAPSQIPSSEVESARRTVRGAFHIHTNRSDGALDKDAVAAAAARAGLQFAIFTDHGNGTRAPDPPAYLHGVLCLDGVEVSTNQGHYIAVAMSQAPYPLGGDASAVAEDVARLGGFGVAAHPLSARGELAWTDWQVPVDGIEWLNADSEWRDERRWRLGKAALDYLWRPAGALAALLDRPVETLRRWDELSATRDVVALAGLDAHGGFGAEADGQRGRRLHIPSYETSFRTFSTYVVLSRPFSQEPATDAKALVEAVRTGAVYAVVDAIATPAALDFQATAGAVTTSMGQVLAAREGPATFRVRASVPSGAMTILKKDGVTVAERGGGVLDYESSSFGVYRVEIDADHAPGSPRVPWLVSNPIYWWPFSPSPSPGAPTTRRLAVLRLSEPHWRVESDPGSSGTVAADGDAVSFTYRLKNEPRASQFVALVVDLQSVPADVDTIAFRARSAQPIRASMQLRYARYEDRRWGSSIYLDQSERQIHVPLGRLRYLGEKATTDGLRPNASRPPTDAVTSLLFVIDLTNTPPGSDGSLTLRDLFLGKD